MKGKMPPKTMKKLVMPDAGMPMPMMPKGMDKMAAKKHPPVRKGKK